MALKMKIGKSAFDALPDDVKKEYKQSGSDYVLDLDGYEDPAEIKRAKDNEVREHSATKRQLAEAKDRVTTLEKEAPDLTKQLNDQKTELEKKHGEELTAANGKSAALRDRFQRNEANRIGSAIANRISTTPKLLSGVIADRVMVEWDKDDNPTVFIKGTDGKRSAMTEQDLEKEISTNKDYAAIIIGTRGSGGGGAPSRNSPGRAGNNPQHSSGSPPDLSKMNPRDLAAQIKESKENAGS